LLIMSILTLSLVTLILSIIKMCGLLSSISWLMLFAPLMIVYLVLFLCVIFFLIREKLS
jgi:hypothetical protein